MPGGPAAQRALYCGELFSTPTQPFTSTGKVGWTLRGEEKQFEHHL